MTIQPHASAERVYWVVDNGSSPPGGGPHGTGSTRGHLPVGIGRHDSEAGMSGRLRRRYERLLFTYQSDYRRAHGDEMVSTLLEAARPDQLFPAPA